MNKCLITRLSSVIQTDNLNKIGHLVLKIHDATIGATTNYADYAYNTAIGSRMELTGAHFVNGNGENIGTVMIKGDGNAKKIVVDEPVITISLYSKYDFEYFLDDGYDEKKFGENAKYAPVKTADLKYCTKMTRLGLFPLKGRVEDLSLMNNLTGITSGYASVTQELSGDLSKLPASVHGFSSHSKNKGVLTYTKNARHGSSNRAISLRNVDECFVDVQNYENYFVAMATNAWDSTIRRGHCNLIEYNKTIAPTQKIKEAIWYLKNKMYKDVGDRTRTAGKYFDVYGIDISDITSDPGWAE